MSESATALKPSELNARLQFALCPGLGPKRQRKLIAAFGRAEAAFNASHRELRAAGLSDALISSFKQIDETRVKQCVSWLEQDNCGLICADMPGFPAPLADLDDAPWQLFFRGDADLLSTTQLAIVGSRNPSPAGRRHARAFAKDLAQRGLVIISGLAAGIDAAAHQGALEANGLTIAVVGTGLDTVYPRQNHQLALDISEQGLLISEYPPGTAAKAAHFPQRNRLIAALSFGSLVVEAAPRSGSLITARLAAELGREVFAMPGSVDHPLARGCHQLIKKGAKLVECADDILEELGPMLHNDVQAVPSTTVESTADNGLDQEYQDLLQHISDAPITIDALVQNTGLSVEQTSSMLLILELHGAVAVAPGGGYQRR